MFNFDHPFYRPLWRRIVIVAFCFAWAAFEFSQAAAFWGVLFAGLGALCGYHFFIARRDD